MRNKGFAKEREKRRVLLIGRERIEQRGGAFGIALSQFGIGEKQGAGAVAGQEAVRTAEIFEGLVQASGCQRQLAGAQEAAGGKVGMLQALGQVSEHHVRDRILRIEQRDALVTGQGINVALMLQKKLRRRAELFDGFGGTILLLQQNAVAHQPVGGLRE